MADLTETQKTALLIAYGVISAYYLVCLFAAYARPSLQRFWLLRPRWRGGVKASRFGVTTQALFVFALGLFGIGKIYGHPWIGAFEVLFFLAALLAVLGWGSDYGRHTDQLR
jgi:hypothetical protein